jgi:hypothetical protein
VLYINPVVKHNQLFCPNPLVYPDPLV